jgi:hypothetical protein
MTERPLNPANARLLTRNIVCGSCGIGALNSLFENHGYDHPLAKGQGYFVRDAHLSLRCPERRFHHLRGLGSEASVSATSQRG